jgi:hypothetical protein
MASTTTYVIVGVGPDQLTREFNSYEFLSIAQMEAESLDNSMPGWAFRVEPQQKDDGEPQR